MSPPDAQMVMLERAGHQPRLAIIGRRHRSKWWEVTCFCKRPRKDGTCLWTDTLVTALRPEIRERGHLCHPDAGNVRVPLTRTHAGVTALAVTPAEAGSQPSTGSGAIK